MPLVLIRDPDDINRLAKFDNKFRVPMVVDSAHHEVHEGCAYLATLLNTSMASGSTSIIAFKTPNTTTQLHFIFEFASKAEAHMELIEGPTWSTGSGSQLSIINRDRNSADTSLVLEDTGGGFTATSNLISDPTTFTGTSILEVPYTWSTKQADTGKGRDLSEFILKQNSTYGLRLIADAASNAGQITLNWYEHTPE